MAETTSPNGLLGRATRGAARGVVGGVKRRRATRKYYKAVGSEAVSRAKREDAQSRRDELKRERKEAGRRERERAADERKVKAAARAEKRREEQEHRQAAREQERDRQRKEADERRRKREEERERAARQREDERAEQKRRQQLLAEQASRKREQKIARAERESIGGGGLLDSQRRSVAARSRRRPLNISSLEEAYGMTNPAPQPHFCADCDAPGNGKLRRQKDGRFVCAKCERRNKDKGSRRRQPTFFADEGREQSTSLFDAAGNPAQLHYSDDKPVKVEGYCLPTHYRAKPSPRGTKAGAREKAATDRKPKHRTKTEARKAKSERPKATRAARGTKKALTDLSLSQFVRRMGGIAPARDREDAGELRYIGQKEGKTTGLLNKNSRYSAEYMMDAANEAGYRDEDGQPFTKPGDFVSAVGTDHHGYYKFFSQAKEYDYASNPLERGSSRAVISRNIAKLRREGYPAKQAAAIAYKHAGQQRKQNPVALMVSPTVARNLLKQSKNPRQLTRAHVDEIAARMRRGTWEPQQSLEFKDGFLVDGQHRLHALIKSGKTYTFPIVANPAVLPTLGTLSLIPGGILASLELHKRFAGKHQKKKQAAPTTPKARNPSEKYLKEKERIDDLSRMFQGAASGALVRVPISRHDAGKDLARLGNLRFLRMHQRPAECDRAARRDDGANGKYHTCRRCTVFFDPHTSYAAIDRDKKIYLAGRGVRRERPTMLQNPDEHVSYGKVDLIGYLANKAHIGDGKRFCYVHPFAEETKRISHKPELLLDSDGMPRLKGGAYDIRAEGIIN